MKKLVLAIIFGVFLAMALQSCRGHKPTCPPAYSQSGNHIQVENVDNFAR